MARKAAVLGVDSFSGMVQQRKPAAPKSTMVLKIQMAPSRAASLACDAVGRCRTVNNRRLRRGAGSVWWQQL